MLRSHLFQMLMYWRVHCALKKLRALPKRKISNFEDDPTLLILFFTASTFFTTPSFAEENYFQEFDGYKVHYSVFSSTSLSAEMAQRYGLVRGKDRVYVNIAVVPADKAFGGVAVDISGRVKNLIQQEKTLEFKTISEADAVYYLAPYRHTNRDVLHFYITVDPEGPAGPFEVKFTKELYVNP